MLFSLLLALIFPRHAERKKKTRCFPGTTPLLSLKSTPETGFSYVGRRTMLRKVTNPQKPCPSPCQ